MGLEGLVTAISNTGKKISIGPVRTKSVQLAWLLLENSMTFVSMCFYMRHKRRIWLPASTFSSKLEKRARSMEIHFKYDQISDNRLFCRLGYINYLNILGLNILKYQMTMLKNK